jgi:two-component system cell cycle response regulator DivK
MRKTIGVVEDNPDNRLLLQAILSDLYEIVEYETGAEALDGLRTALPDLLLLDISLPGLDGVAVLEQIRGSDAMKALPVIALTAHAMAGDRAKYLAAGFNDYVSKPIVDEAVLLDTIQKWLPSSG